MAAPRLRPLASADSERIGILVLETLETALNHDAARAVLATALRRQPIPDDPIAARGWVGRALSPALAARLGSSVATTVAEAVDQLLERAAGAIPTAKPCAPPSEPARPPDHVVFPMATARSGVRALRRVTGETPSAASPTATVVLSPDPHLVAELERHLRRPAGLRYSRSAKACTDRLAGHSGRVLLVVDASHSSFEGPDWSSLPEDTHVVLRGGSATLRAGLERSGLRYTPCAPDAESEDLADVCRVLMRNG